MRALVESRILQFPPERIGARKQLEILLDSEHLHDGRVRADGYPCATSLDAPQGHWRHAGALGDLGGSQASAKPRKAQPVTKLPQQLLGDWQQKGGFLGHDVNILAVNRTNRQNIYTAAVGAEILQDEQIRKRTSFSGRLNSHESLGSEGLPMKRPPERLH